ncbi:MAG: hypothetical protein HON62_03825 [Rhodospirillaceae bacterium]|jgi:hypothetical protein|nr:hypothetical protein [Rhodospirillaceae bacterium]MBT5415364.1 hypothetical protein [Rhodospirillaceae bacterium]MBT6117832.1 hypothetical protein [Rhodospirillaceae bacterium]
MRILVLAATLLCGALFSATPGLAENFSFLDAVELQVGESVILKGVRNRECGDPAPDWDRISDGLPSSDLGSLSDGGTGFTESDRCGGRVPARGIKFTANEPGMETLEIYKDSIRITVK